MCSSLEDSNIQSVKDANEFIETTEVFVANINQLLSSGFERAVYFASRGTEAAIAA